MKKCFVSSADSSKHTYDACIKAAKECDLLVAIVDGRYGGDFPNSEKSITQVEIEAALDAGKQVRIFVRRAVWDAKEVLRPYQKKELEFLPSKIVSDERVFSVIDELRRRNSGNWIFQFDTPTDILTQLGHQFGFEPALASDKTTIDNLDRIIASKLFRAFPDALITSLSRGFQIGNVRVDSTEELDSGLAEFDSEAMRFADESRNEKLLTFLRSASVVNNEAPSVFAPGVNTDCYVWSSVLGSGRFELDRRQTKLGNCAIAMEEDWRSLCQQIRNIFPDVIMAIHDNV